jgi:AAA family ATP:ADP antiporter
MKTRHQKLGILKQQTTPPDPQESPEEVFEDAPVNMGLLSRRRKSIRDRLGPSERREWMRPYWLGFGLFLILFAFWLLDSLKDPVFARLVDGNLDRHQPPAKLCSVVTTLLLVCLMEYLANVRQQQEARRITTEPEILDAGGIWNRMPMVDASEHQRHAVDDNISISIFAQIGVPYAIAFVVIAYLLYKFEAVEEHLEEGFDIWYVLAYVLYATTESFGSLAVATFWSYANSTLSLNDAEQYYGTIIAVAQLGAIGGSTIVASDHWQAPSLLIVVSLVIVLQLITMKAYDGRFKPTSVLAKEDDVSSLLTWQDDDVTLTKPFWSGIYLIIRHNYVLLILGVSCLYEIALTCLDYQMKLLGWARFEMSPDVSMSFSQFMGHYGQVVNLTSLFLSSIIFPFLIRNYGLRITLRFFPTLLLIATVVAFGAVPGNLAVIFFSLSILKAMTYSVHDPSKEILYIPTSNAVKFRAKFWIDVVGERIFKAIGSGFNTFAGSVDRSVQIGSIPSLLSAAGLWAVCYYAGIEFDRLLKAGKIVGLEQSVNPTTYKRIPKEDMEIEFTHDDEDNISTLGSIHDRIQDAATPNSQLIELPQLVRL